MSRLENKIALIVGGSSGIGEACVRLFQKHKAKVLFCSNKEEEGRKLENELNKCESEKVEFFYCEVRNDAEVLKLIDTITTKYNQLDCLLNIVGYHPVLKPMEEFSVEEMRDLLNINVVSHFHFAKLCLKMLRQSKGTIVNMSSMCSHIGQRLGITYATTKAAILGMTKSMALDEAVNGVRAVSVSPGFVKTPLYLNHINDVIQKNLTDGITKPGEETLESITKEYMKVVPMQRQAESIEIAQTCLFLVTDGSYITGTDVEISGGLGLFNT